MLTASSLRSTRLTQAERSAVTEAAALLLRAFPVARVVLYGSKARGDSDAESDVDLLVLTTRPLSRDERHALGDAVYEISLRHDVYLSPVVIPSDEWSTGRVSVLPFHAEVEEQGVAV